MDSFRHWSRSRRQSSVFVPSLVHKRQLENVAIANALQLEATRATPAFSRFNYDAMPSLKSLNLSNLL